MQKPEGKEEWDRLFKRQDLLEAGQVHQVQTGGEGGSGRADKVVGVQLAWVPAASAPLPPPAC